MGDSEITMARNYWKGASGHLALDSLPATGAVTTHSVEEYDPRKPDYVTDSAASAIDRLQVLVVAGGCGDPLSRSSCARSPAPIELARERGMNTGFATTGGISTATEAAFTAHVRARGCMGPQSMQPCFVDRRERGGPGSVAEQQIDHEVDVMLGGGRTYFEQTIAAGPDRGRTVLEAARARGYETALDARDLRAAPHGRRLLGLFSPAGMSAEWDGRRAEPGEGSGPQRCEHGRRPPEQPSLVEMAHTMLERLENDRGFLALIEGANIDTYSHSAQPCEEIGEVVEFDRAVRLALDYQREHPNTLVVVTADHGHAAQIVPVDVEPEARPPGRFSTLVTGEGARMRISYSTVGPIADQKHTGTQVRIAAKGPHADRVLGLTDQTDVFRALRTAIGAE